MNGLAYAVGIRSGQEKEAAKSLSAAWIKYGGWQDTFSLNFMTFITGRGLSNSSGILKMMRESIKPCTGDKKRDVELRILVTPLNGAVNSIGKKPATSYEKIITFTGPDFDTQERLDKVFKVVTAACAFPGLFLPVEIEGLGPCVDGGVVNNAPLEYALEQSDVNRVLIPVTFPAVMERRSWISGFGLLNHLIEILINERLYRDLKDAQSINHNLDHLKSMVDKNIINQDQLNQIQSALYIRNVDITEIRPTMTLKSGPFAGFFKKRDRILLVEAGRQAALETLARLPLRNPEGIQTT